MGKLQTAIDALSTLSRAELVQVRAVINGLLTAGYLDDNAGVGHIEYKFITRNGKRFGPYKHRRVWKAGKLTDVYIGRASAEEYADWQAKHAASDLRSRRDVADNLKSLPVVDIAITPTTIPITPPCNRLPTSHRRLSTGLRTRSAPRAARPLNEPPLATGTRTGSVRRYRSASEPRQRVDESSTKVALLTRRHHQSSQASPRPARVLESSGSCAS